MQRRTNNKTPHALGKKKKLEVQEGGDTCVPMVDSC